MSNLIKGEFYKLRKDKYFFMIIFLTLVAIWFTMVQYDDNIRVLDKFDPELMTGMYSIKFSFRCILFTSFLYAIFAAQYIVKDLNETISKSFIYGYKRSKVIVSKLIVFIISCLFIELIYTTVLVWYGRAYWFDYSMETILYLIRIIVIGIMYNVATISIVVMIAIITKSRVLTVVSPILFLLFGSIFSLPPSILDLVFYICPLIIGEAAVARFASTSEVIGGIVSSVLTIVITIGSSLLYVKSEDIK